MNKLNYYIQEYRAHIFVIFVAFAILLLLYYLNTWPLQSAFNSFLFSYCLEYWRLSSIFQQRILCNEDNICTWRYNLH